MGATISAHKFAFLSVPKNRGVKIEEGQVVRHMCHTPECVNPRHLELGTFQQNNVEDKKRNGTYEVSLSNLKQYRR